MRYIFWALINPFLAPVIGRGPAMQSNGVIRVLAIGALALTWIVAPPAQAQDPYRVRGKLTVVALPNFTVETLDGEVLELTLSEESNTYSVTPGTLKDIDQGQFVGITSIDVEGDRRVALEVHIFAEDLRGLGEGHYPWDLVREPNMMTNATIAEIDTVEDGPLLTVTYAEGEDEPKSQGQQTIHIPSDVPIVHLATCEAAALAPGKDVFLFLKDDDAGQATPLAVAVGEGVRPPM